MSSAHAMSTQPPKGAALVNVAHRKMTVAEFEAWEPQQHANRKWQLIDGTPVCMAPTKPNHGRIMANLTTLLQVHLWASRPGCDVVIAPGIIPNIRPDKNELIPDLAVTCEQASPHAKIPTAPVILIEVLSEPNEAISRRNAETYQSMPSVQEILLLDSLAVRAEIMRRSPNQSWPQKPAIAGAADPLDLTSIGFTTPMAEVYRATGLVLR